MGRKEVFHKICGEERAIAQYHQSVIVQCLELGQQSLISLIRPQPTVTTLGRSTIRKFVEAVVVAKIVPRPKTEITDRPKKLGPLTYCAVNNKKNKAKEDCFNTTTTADI